MINLTWNLIIAHVSMNVHIKILINSIINIIITHVDIFRGKKYATRKIKRCCFKEIFDIEFNCAENRSSVYPLPVDKGEQRGQCFGGDLKNRGGVPQQEIPPYSQAIGADEYSPSPQWCQSDVTILSFLGGGGGVV